MQILHKNLGSHLYNMMAGRSWPRPGIATLWKQNKKEISPNIITWKQVYDTIGKNQWRNRINSHISNNIQTTLTNCQKGANCPVEKWANDMHRQYTEEQPKWQNFSEKVLKNHHWEPMYFKISVLWQ